MERLLYFPGKFARAVESIFNIPAVDLLDLSNNSNQRGPSDQVIECIKDKAKNIYCYPEDPVIALQEAVINYIGSDKERIIFGNGSAEVLSMIAQCYLRAGSELIISKYTYNFYKQLAFINRAKLIEVDRIHWQQRVENILQAINSETAMVIMANPDNPIATWLSLGAIESLLKSLPSHIMLVVDEAYFEYMNESNYASAVSLIHRFPNLVVVRTFSKLFALAGLRLGYAVCNQEVFHNIERYKSPYNVGYLAFYAGVAALSSVEHNFLSLYENKQGMQKMTDFCEAHGIAVVSCHANFITLDFGEYAYQIFESLARQGILVNHLESYGLSHMIRITIGTREQMAKLCSVLSSVLCSLREDVG